MGQFLAMLARVCDGEKYRDAVNAGQAWDQVGLEMALEKGLLRQDDVIFADVSRLGEPITRQEVAVLLDRLLPEEITSPVYFWQEIPPIQENLLDWEDMEDCFRDAVERLYELYVVRGNDQKKFSGANHLHRADGTALLMRALELLEEQLDGTEVEITVTYVDTEGNVLDTRNVSTRVGDDFWYYANGLNDKHYKLASEYDTPSRVSSICTDYEVVFRRLSEKEVYRNEMWQKIINDELTPEERREFELHVPGSNRAKDKLLREDIQGNFFEDQAKVESLMTQVTVPVWHLARDGSKYSSTATITVHRGLAADVQAIFTEIYHDPEQFPIQSVGGYRWEVGSEHGFGAAIDINPSQNYLINDGRVEFPGHWKPGVDPLSIPENGSVVRIFDDYGWSWGGNAWSVDADPSMGRHDYMHFSYQGY